MTSFVVFKQLNNFFFFFFFAVFERLFIESGLNDNLSCV